MRSLSFNLSAALLTLSLSGGAVAQEYAGPVGGNGVGTPVDRNVADTGANRASQRPMQPGLGQFGVGSLLLDRCGKVSLWRTGVAPDVDSMKKTARTMMLTMIPYCLIQGAAFAYAGEQSEEERSKHESIYALIGLVVCVLFFIWYLHSHLSRLHPF